IVMQDCSHVSIVKFEGMRGLVGADEFTHIIETLDKALEPYFVDTSHSITSFMRRDEMSVEQIKELMKPMYATASRQHMTHDMHDILNDQAATMAQLSMNEENCFALWTNPSALSKEDRAEWVAEQNALFRDGLAPNVNQAQDGTRAIPALMERHRSFVETFRKTLQGLGGNISLLKVEDAIRTQKHTIEPRTTPPGWQPWLLGAINSRAPRTAPQELRTTEQKNGTKVVSVANLAMYFPPSLARQIVGHKARYTEKEGYLVYGGRMYATIIMDMGPRLEVAFSDLMNHLNSVRVKTPQGTRMLPFSIAQEIHGDGLRSKSLAISIGQSLPFNDNNRDFNRAVRTLREQKLKFGEPIVSYTFMLTTWVDTDLPDAERELNGRVVKLINATQQWGSAKVNEYTIDRMQGLFSSSLAVSRRHISKFATPTLSEALKLMPFARPASPFLKSGVELYRTLDGRLLTTTAHSSEQDYSLYVDIAAMGGGKSVLANRRHLEFVLQPGLQDLPFLHIMDIGESASGVIFLIQDALPPELKHKVYFHKLRNEQSHSINMLDTQPGLRYPLESQLDSMVDWLTALVTPAERQIPYENMGSFARIILNATFHRCDDANDQGFAKTYMPGQSLEVDRAIAELGLPVKAQFTKWWTIVDRLYDANKMEEMLIAQRFCSPLLSDVESVASDENVVAELRSLLSETGNEIARLFVSQLQAAKQEFPIFTDVTRIDLRGRRVTAIDLNDVAIGDSPSARKRASIMFMVAYNLFVRNIRLSKEDLPRIPNKYYGYYSKLLQEIQEIPKRVTIDEFHRTAVVPPQELAANPNAADNYGLRQTLIREGGREARKWGLSVNTISQRPGDHGGLLSLASGVFVLKTPGDNADLAILQEKMELGTTGTFVVKQFLNGPQAGVGATMLARYNLKDGAFNQLITNSLGGKLMWSTSTTPEDKALRAMLYEEIGRPAARAVLKYHFPGGSAKSDIEMRKTKMTSGRDVMNQDVDASAIRNLANELIGFYRANPQNYQVDAKV
ncbi:MAG: hypothetical protein JNM52_04835, partial [Betaproteobacteria bacterium]|nr:hypothetical protein [Betaproteobacteria bacterium]